MSESVSERMSRNRRFLSEVRKSFTGTIAQRLVLEYITRKANVRADPCKITFTKAQISEGTGLERKAVQRALRALREHGVIFPPNGTPGGRHQPVTYLFRVAGSAEPADRLSDDLDAPWQAAMAIFRQQSRSMAESWFSGIWLYDVDGPEGKRTARLAHENAFHVSHITADLKMMNTLLAVLNTTIPGGVDRVELRRASRR